MTQGSVAAIQLLLVFLGTALARVQHWPSTHMALSNGSVFIGLSYNHNATERGMTVSLVDMETGATVLSRPVSINQSEGILEFNCTCFLYAGTFKFKLEEDSEDGGRNATQWWSQELQVLWPTFHIAVERAGNQSSDSFQIGISTNDNFQPCFSGRTLSLYLEVTYLEYNQIGRNSIDKVRGRRRREIKVTQSQHLEWDCVFPFTERDFIRVSLKSPHSPRDIKTSGPLYLARIFSYKLLVDNAYRAGCEGTVAVRLLPPPCAFTSGKVLLYREAGATATADEGSPPLAFNWLTQGENETEFNCSVFDPGRNKYCFRFLLSFSRSPSPAWTCVIVQRSAEMWGLWQSWSGCSVSCGEGVRERFRECLTPSGGGLGCTGMIKEQSHCSLEDCAAPLPSLSPLPPLDSAFGGNLVVVAGISLCLAVILATVLITVWRKVCYAPKCGAGRRGSVHSPGGRKNSDEASICGHSQQRPSFSESLQAAPATQAGGKPPEPAAAASRQSQPLQHPQDPERVSPNAQKIVPPIFGYRLAHQQLKEMKRKGLKETTKVYHVSQSPIDDTMLETTASTSAALTPLPSDSQEEANLGRFRIKSPFLETPKMSKTSVTLPDRLSPKADFLLRPPPSTSGNALRHQRTADWVEMVERAGSYQNNPSFRRTSSFHESKPQEPHQPFRERSMTQVPSRQLPEGSCKTRVWDSHCGPGGENQGPSRSKLMYGGGNDRRRPWVEAATRPKDWGHDASGAPSGTEESDRPDPPGVRGPGLRSERASRAELHWSRRGPSPIQRNILARKLREANSSATYHRQRSSTVAQSDVRRDKCRSLPLSGDYAGYHSSHYGLTESEQRMMDLSGFSGEEDSMEVLSGHRLT